MRNRQKKVMGCIWKEKIFQNINKINSPLHSFAMNKSHYIPNSFPIKVPFPPPIEESELKPSFNLYKLSSRFKDISKVVKKKNFNFINIDFF